MEGLRSDGVAALNIDHRSGRIGDIRRPCSDPIPQDLRRRLEPEPGKGNALVSGELRQRVALPGLYVYGIDVRLPPLRHQGALAQWRRPALCPAYRLRRSLCAEHAGTRYVRHRFAQNGP